jgi:hypothetical protein
LMSHSTESFVCPTCLKGYKRREHLQRHSVTHLVTRPYQCDSCNATFSRTDILRRHVRTCSALQEDKPNPSRKRACDRCSRQKKACNLVQPCRNCLSKALPCQYSYAIRNETDHEGILNNALAADVWDVEISARSPPDTIAGDVGFAQDLDMFLHGTFSGSHSAQSTNHGLDWLGFLGVSDMYSGQHVDSLGNNESQHQFRFLYNFTSRTGLSSTFDCGTPIQRQRALGSMFDEQSENDSENVLEDRVDFASTEPVSRELWLFDPLIVQIHGIVSRVKELVTSKPRNSFIRLSWTAAVEQQCIEFFSPDNIRLLLTAYWMFWHPNVNFVHKPTFDAAKCSSSLLAAMVIIGTLCTM